MTFLPCEAQRISYVSLEEDGELPAYALPKQCAHPNCAEQREPGGGHHVVRRSHTQGKGPQEWIAIDGKPVPNKIGLCHEHHRLITVNEARISYYASETIPGHWYWAERVGPSWSNIGMLQPLPLTEGVALGADALGEREPVAEGASRTAASRSHHSEGPDLSLPGAGYDVSPASPGPSETCPTCNRKLPKPKAELQEERPKVSWSIKVPKDARENGYELLRSLVEQCQVELGRQDEPPYYVLVEVMHFFLTSPKEKVA